MMVCPSHKSTLDLIDKLCADHDSVVANWRDSLADTFLTLQHSR